MAEFTDYGMTVANSEITGLGTLAEVFKYELKNTANTFTETETNSRDNGTIVYDQVTEITTTGLTAALVNQAKLLARSTFLLFLEDNNGRIFCSGLYRGVDKTTGTRVTGGNLGDLMGLTMSLQAQEKEPAQFLSTSAVTSFRLLVSDVYVNPAA